MLELQSDHYWKVTPIVSEVPFNNLFARVVIEQKVEGQVFVDDLSNPTVCLIIHKYGMALLCGNDTNVSFNNNLVSYLNHPSPNGFPAKWLLTYPQKWEQKLVDLLDHNKTYFLQTQRINYQFNPQFPLQQPNIPDGFTLQQIDSALFHKIQGSVVPQHFWNTVDDFLEHGIGFSLLYENQIISSCFSSYIVEDKLELGVETSENFRNKGYSIYAASALIKYCLQNGYEPIWGCRRENIGSSRLAESLGFVPLSYHPYYCMPS